MSAATIVKSRRLSDQELKILNENSISVRGRGLFLGGSVTKYSDGRCVATYAMDNENVANVNAPKIGEKMLELFDFIDEVERDGIIVAKR